MKNILKKILEILKIKEEVSFFYAKSIEQYMKYFFKSDSSKEKYIQKKFKKKIGYEIDFNKEPQTFNEKIQFRKLYDNTPLYSICADKYRVREYIKEKIGEEYLIPLHLVTDKLTKEQWDNLPNQFVAKTNHDSGTVKIIKNKDEINKSKIIRELNNQLKLDYGILSMEKYYSDIPRKIIVEKFLEENIIDYKFMCFSGKMENCFICLNRHTTGLNINFYDRKWNLLPFERHYKNSKEKIEKPILYEKMIELSEKLAKDFDFVRVDFYEVNNKIYFGELTFCPGAGFEEFTPEEWDYKIGSYWKQKKLK